MFRRFRKFFHNHSFFLFGPRGCGKTTLLKERFVPSEVLWLDLLDSAIEERFTHNISEFYAIVKGLKEETKYVIVDEIQKIPKLLDEVHRLIEETDKIFILTGSSARKLKHGVANLLAGRAFVYHLYPLSCFELGEVFDLEKAMHYGTLPKIFKCMEDGEKEAFLRAYADTYLKEEIWNEQIIRKLNPFRRFLEVASQCNGKVVNYANISKYVGVDEKTVKEYYCILEDTMIGFFLEPFHNSFRKRLVEKPKFYFFDTGIVRALSRRLSVSLTPKTSAYGDAFEHYVLLEIIRLASYFEPDYRFSFILTAAGVEVDIVIERPGKPLLCIEIKSSDVISESDIGSYCKLTADIENCEAIVLSQDRFLKKIKHVSCYPWQIGLAEIFPQVSKELPGRFS